ncbi:splicing factor, Prp19-binding domain-containing protein [Dimargaris cristalligena]|uniref:Splicing factor, Prp19-binding domain-containing protein n=1 Tax=Dimargaris cristalligena TaxID=215637 RepID=A0A4P9ZPQ0_9FUNG|nr:splicing factor, Prp19-binding domain-containing protein [Dimargaris cristalligena]|eukprot:RKP35178.1 splicing factor, Prp19-binding domain-containing protein [Dimargaris cristalligena]
MSSFQPNLPTKPKAKTKVQRFWPGKAPDAALLERSSSEGENEPLDAEPGEWAVQSESDSEDEGHGAAGGLRQTTTHGVGAQPGSPPIVSAFRGKISLPTATAPSWAAGSVGSPSGSAGSSRSASPARSWSHGEEDSDLDDRPSAAATTTTTTPGRQSKSSSGPGASTTPQSESEGESVLLKPVFVSRAQRALRAQVQQNVQVVPTPADAPKASPTADDTKAMEERKRATRQMIEDAIRAEQLEARGTTQDDLLEAADDTDNLDPAAERAEWEERERARGLRNQQEEEARVEEIREAGRRQNLTPAEQRAIDALRRKQQQEREIEKRESRQAAGSGLPGAGPAHHKGAFFSDQFGDLARASNSIPPVATAAATKSAVEALPDIMKVKNFGRASQTKWKSLKHEDTSRSDALWNSERSHRRRHSRERDRDESSRDRRSSRREYREDRSDRSDRRSDRY